MLWVCRMPGALLAVTSIAAAPSPTLGAAGWDIANVRVARCEEVSSTVRARPDSISAAAKFKCATGLAHAESTLTDQARRAPIRSPTRQALLGMIRSGTKAQEKMAS